MKFSARKALVYSFWAVALLGVLVFAQQSARSQPADKPPLYNTAKAKLYSGKQIFSFTQDSLDLKGYCEKAKHYDYTGLKCSTAFWNSGISVT